MSIGIYKITNPNGRIYIGQSNNIERRFEEYKNIKFSSQIKLKNSIIKYGLENHMFEIIEECNIIVLNDRERYWQEYYDVLNKGLNCRLTKTPDKSGYDSPETRHKKSQSLLKPILQYDLNGNFIARWDSIKEAQTQLNLSRISRSCLEKSKSVGGFIFRHESSPLPNNYTPPPHGNKGKIISNETKQKMSLSGKGSPQPISFILAKIKPVLCYTKYDEYVCEFSSINEAAQTLNLDKSAISKCCRGIYNTTKQYKFKFKTS